MEIATNHQKCSKKGKKWQKKWQKQAKLKGSGKKVEIGEQIKKYCESKEEEKALKKKLSALSGDIKGFLMDNGIVNEDVGEWRVTLQTKVAEDIDMEKLIDVLQAYWDSTDNSDSCPYIKYVPVVDMEELEKSIYKEDIPSDILMKIDSCRIKKETKALIYKRIKE